MDDKLLEAIGAHVSGLVGRAVTDLGHQVHTLEATTHSVVNTLRFAPVRLDKKNREKPVNNI